MSEVKGNQNSANSSGPIQSSRQTMPSINLAKPKIPEKPLASSAPLLHPLQKSHAETPAIKSIAGTPAPSHHPQSTPPAHSETKPAAQPANNIQFNSAAGSKNSQKIDPFAEQNAKRAAKEQKQAKTRKKTIKLSIIIGGIIILAGAIAGGIFIWQKLSNPSEAELEKIAEQQREELISENGEYVFNTNAATDIQKEVDKIISSGGSVDEISTFFDQKLKEITKEDERINVVLLEMQTYSRFGQPEKLINAAKNISDKNMTKYQKYNYYGFLYSAYNTLGQSEIAEHYYNLLIENNSNN